MYARSAVGASSMARSATMATATTPARASRMARSYATVGGPKGPAAPEVRLRARAPGGRGEVGLFKGRRSGQRIVPTWTARGFRWLTPLLHRVFLPALPQTDPQGSDQRGKTTSYILPAVAASLAAGAFAWFFSKGDKAGAVGVGVGHPGGPDKLQSGASRRFEEAKDKIQDKAAAASHARSTDPGPAK